MKQIEKSQSTTRNNKYHTMNVDERFFIDFVDSKVKPIIISIEILKYSSTFIKKKLQFISSKLWELRFDIKFEDKKIFKTLKTWL